MDTEVVLERVDDELSDLRDRVTELEAAVDRMAEEVVVERSGVE